MRRVAVALAGVFLLGGVAMMAGAGAATGAPSLQTVVGAKGTLDAPGGIALDSAGDLFIADTDHCRVLLVPSHTGSQYGLHMQAHHTYTLAGGTCGQGPLSYPTGVAVDHHGTVYIAEATAQRVLMVQPGGHRGPHSPVTVAGTGVAGDGGNGLPANQSALNEPTGVAVDTAGDLFIADTANCRVRMVPASAGNHFGQAMAPGHLYNVAGTGVCGSAGRGGPAGTVQLSNPVAVAVDGFGDLYVADNGDQSVLEVAAVAGSFYGTAIGAGDAATVVGGQGNGPYLLDGLAANGPTAELNDPEGLAVSPAGTLFISDGSQHCIRVVPHATMALFGRTMGGGDLYTLVGALPITTDQAAPGNGTRWVLTHMGVPDGIAVTPGGSVYFSDRSDNQVREIR